MEVIVNKRKFPKDVWETGDFYEPYVGRWSRLVAKEFLDWLNLQPNARWLDVGCGTGALSQAIVSSSHPKLVKGVDRSDGYIEYAQNKAADSRTEFEIGDAEALPVSDAAFDAAVSGLVLNFVLQPAKMVSEMARSVKKGGVVALYVWDYAGKMQLMRHFWNAAVALNPQARDLDEGRRFPMCNPASLNDLFQQAGLKNLETRAIDIPTDFKDFHDYWSPFLGGQAPAPGYAMSLDEEKRAELRERIRIALPFALDGTIPLVARAWAVKGVK